MTESIRLAVIYGSNREQRFCDVVGTWALSRLAVHGAEPEEAIRDFKERIAAADAFLIVTPEYNHGYPAVLKFLIDSALQEWHEKPAAFVSDGGQSGGLRAVEQLRLVFAELRVVTMRESVSLINAWDQFDGTGRLREPAAANQAIAAMLDQLARWSQALHHVRVARAEPSTRSARSRCSTTPSSSTSRSSTTFSAAARVGCALLG